MCIRYVCEICIKTKKEKKKEIEGGIYARMFLSGVFCTHSDNVINNLFKSYIIDDEERNISYV